MSGSLGTIPYPTAGQDDTAPNPLDKYRRQLDPLAKLTDQMWQTPAAPPTGTIQPPMPEPSMLSPIGQRAVSGVAGMPSMGPMAMPQTSQTPQAPLPTLPTTVTPQQAAAAATPAQAMPGATGSAALAGQSQATPGATPWASATSAPAAGATPQPMGRSARMLASLAPEVPSYDQGQQPGADATPPGATPPTATPPPAAGTPGMMQSRDQDRISTRIPSEPAQRAQGIDAHSRNDMSIGIDSLRQGKEAWDKNAALIKQHYPGFQNLRTNDPDRIIETFIQHEVDNLKFIHRKMTEDPNIGPGTVERSTHWYEGANRIAHGLAREYNIHPRQAAAVLAALSPQKDWFQNVDLARRVLDIHRRQGNLALTPEMSGYSQRYIQSLRDADKNPTTIAKLEGLRSKFATTPFQQITDPYERAVWARWYDEAHNPRSYRIVNPEGSLGDYAMNPAKVSPKTGKELQPARQRAVTWGSFNEIHKAMAALQSADLPTISRLMGENHKVRNFFNNIIAPNAPHGDVTSDTHAIAAGLLRPLGASSLEVGHGLGTTVGRGRPGAADNATLGNKGLYGLHAEAYRRAAADLKLLPRQLQSIAWEGVRGLFSPEQKRDKKFVQHIDDIWSGKGQYSKMTPEQKREAIYAHAGGIKAPAWAGGGDYGDEE
jgi:hypothetical protein